MRVAGCTCVHCSAEPTPDQMILYVTTTMNVLIGRLTGRWVEDKLDDDTYVNSRWIEGHPNIGALLIPQIPAMWKDGAERLAQSGMSWACDNGGFVEFKPEPFLRMLDAVSSVPSCHFVASPDVYNNAAGTIAYFEEWEPKIHSFGLPVAFICQLGMKEFEVPWDRCEAIFIGGADNVDGEGWHRSEHVEQLIHEAARRGKWVHVGRISTWRKMMWARAVGDVHSVDGSAHGRFPDLMLDKGLFLAREAVQGRLEFTTEGDTDDTANDW